MQVFRAMVEQKLCANDPACQPYQVYQGRCPHAKTSIMRPDGDISDEKRGPQQRVSSFLNRGTHAEVMVADVGEWRPLLDEAEQAALRVGGLKAVQKMQKAKERERIKEEHVSDTAGHCRCGKSWPCPIRFPPKNDVKHAPDYEKQKTHGYRYVPCVCNGWRDWGKCSQLKKVQKQLAKGQANAG